MATRAVSTKKVKADWRAAFRRSMRRAGQMAGAAALFGAMRAGTIKANIGQTFALSEIAKAHETLESGQTVGATLLLP